MNAPEKYDVLVLGGGTAGKVMAWTMANTKPEKLALALGLAGTAVAQAPEQLRFLDTRGQILEKLERWQDANADLQKAAQAMPDSKELQAALVRVSAHLVNQSKEPKTRSSAK